MNQSRIGLFMVLALSIVFVLAFYGKIIFSPNSYQFSDQGDAIKNYYTYSYYIANNQSAINFEGLNYPYGEHFLYTDCTPVLAVSLRILASVFPGISNYSVGIINFILIISFLFTALFLYLVFIELKIYPWLAALSAIAIMALSPQVFRLSGHLALGFGTFIPLTWYLLLKLENSPDKVKYALFLFASNLVLFFIHAYIAIIAAAMLTAYLLISFIFDSLSKSRNMMYYYFLTAATFLPILIFRVFIFITDTHTGRTDNPWGFFVHHSNVESVFLPTHPPLRKWLDGLNLTFDQIWEGWAYVGLVSIFAILFYLIAVIVISTKKRKLAFNNTYFENRHLQIMGIAAILILLFSFGYPFRWNMEKLLDFFSVLKQFRAVGRFAWVFYFVVTVSSVYLFDRIGKQLILKNKRWLAYLIMFMIPLLYFTEAYAYHQQASQSLTSSPNMFDKAQLSPDLREGIEAINPDDYQAIMPMPFFNIGSENYDKYAPNKMYMLAQVMSYHTHLPVLGSYLTRTSIWESKNILQVLTPAYYPSLLKDDLPSDKPFLIVDGKEKLTAYEQDIINRSKVIFECDEFILRELQPDNLFYNNATEEIQAFELQKDNLFFAHGFYSTDTSAIILYNDYETTPFSVAFRGSRGFRGEKKSYNKLVTFKADELEYGVEYVASFWMYNKGENFGQDQLNVMFVVQESKDGKSDWATVDNPRYSTVINGDWSLAEIPFKVKTEGAEVVLMLKGDNNSDMVVYLDDFFLYKAGSTHYKIEAEKDGKIMTLFKNNQQIKMPKKPE